MDSSVSSWLSELGMVDSFLNDQCEIMDFLDDEFLSSALGDEDLQDCLLSPTLIPPNSSTTSSSVLSAMETPPLIFPIERPAKKQKSSSSPVILTFGNPVIPEPPETSLRDNALSTEVLTTSQGGSILNLNEVTKSHAQKPKKSGGRGRVRPPSQTYDHIIAERKRREQLSQCFVALSAIVPGLKKMDKTSLLVDAINYLKYLQQRVKTLEEQAAKQTMESVVLVKRSQVFIEDEGSSDEACGGPDDHQPLPEIEAKVCNKNILLRVHCEKHKGVLIKLLSQVEKLNLSVINTSVAPFGSLALDITIIALMETGFNLIIEEVIKSLRVALREVAQAD